MDGNLSLGIPDERGTVHGTAFLSAFISDSRNEYKKRQSPSSTFLVSRARLRRAWAFF